VKIFLKELVENYFRILANKKTVNITFPEILETESLNFGNSTRKYATELLETEHHKIWE